MGRVVGPEGCAQEEHKPADMTWPPRPSKSTRMHSLVYVSSARAPFSKLELRELLEHAARNNERHSVTGLLLYRAGSFMQLLEGEEATVEALFAKISADFRHSSAILMHRSQDVGRMFPRWSMACRDLDDADVKALPGFSQFLEPSICTRTYFENPTRAQKLLVYFKEAMR
ncbi:MAG: hypothetical protein C0487_04320 [Leptothrix sp. (in: Bacteria)]|nr:hypothetical protein [Leptothrix sp. (in: b-proteobacteria)]